jgi:hypothetical protein
MGDPFKELSDFFGKIGDMFKKLDGFFGEIAAFFVKIGNAFKAVGTFFTFIGDVFTSIFSYITCGFKMIITLPKCFKWYSLDILGKTLYSPIGFLFFALGLQEIEKMIWDIIQSIDCFILSIFGSNISKVWDDATHECYSCKITPIPSFPVINL